MPKPFFCLCGNTLYMPNSNQQDLKCAKCGRVFTATGRYLWREAAGNDLVGSSDIINEPMITEEEDRRAKDQDKAMEKAFVEAKLPEEDRREPEPVVTETPPANPVVEPPPPPAGKSARGDKRSR